MNKETLSKSEKQDLLWIRACKGAQPEKRFSSILRRFYGGKRAINKPINYADVFWHIYHATKNWYPDIEKETLNIINDAFRREDNESFFSRLQGEEIVIPFGKNMLDSLRTYVMITDCTKYVKHYPSPAFIRNKYGDKYVDR